MPEQPAEESEQPQKSLNSPQKSRKSLQKSLNSPQKSGRAAEEPEQPAEEPEQPAEGGRAAEEPEQPAEPAAAESLSARRRRNSLQKSRKSLQKSRSSLQKSAPAEELEQPAEEPEQPAEEPEQPAEEPEEPAEEPASEGELEPNAFVIPVGTLSVFNTEIPLYESPSIDASILANLQAESLVTVISKDDAWALIDFEGLQGYVSLKNLVIEQPGVYLEPALYIWLASASSVEYGDTVVLKSKLVGLDGVDYSVTAMAVCAH